MSYPLTMVLTMTPTTAARDEATRLANKHCGTGPWQVTGEESRVTDPDGSSPRTEIYLARPEPNPLHATQTAAQLLSEDRR